MNYGGKVYLITVQYKFNELSISLTHKLNIWIIRISEEFWQELVLQTDRDI